MSDNLTTAAYLGQFRAELLDAGIPHYEADSLVRDAARQILRDQGVSVRAGGAPTNSRASRTYSTPATRSNHQGVSHMRTVITSRGVMESLAFSHPGAQMELTSEAAYLTLGPVTYYALLGGGE